MAFQPGVGLASVVQLVGPSVLALKVRGFSDR